MRPFRSFLRLRVVALSLSPSSETVSEPRGKDGRVESWGREARDRGFLAPGFRAASFSLAVFFRVTQDGLSERGTTHCPLEATVDYQQTCILIGDTELQNQCAALTTELFCGKSPQFIYFRKDSIMIEHHKGLSRKTKSLKCDPNF